MYAANDVSEYEATSNSSVDQSVADEFTSQVETFYSLPRKRRSRLEIVFSPSGVTKCARELYYAHTDAPQDEIPLIPWRERMSRNGTAVHDATQADYLRMEQVLRDAGHSVRFRFLEAEINGEKSYMVGNRKVTIRGRSDGRIGLLDDDGNVVQEIGWELKTKDKRTNMNKVLKEGVQLGHRKQAVAYALIFGITKWIFEYQSMQKPEWKDVDPEKPDIKHFYVQVDPDEARQLLLRLAKVVEQIETKTLPAPELDKCGFCAFKTQCRLDGGYQG